MGLYVHLETKVDQPEFRAFNDLIKLTLEEDEYKRDDFLALALKTSLKNGPQRENSLSDDNSNHSRSSARLKPRKANGALRWRREAAGGEGVRRAERGNDGGLHSVQHVMMARYDQS